MRFPIRITHNLLLEPVLHTFGVKPEGSFVELTDTELEVSMGRWFHERLPLEAVASMAASDWPWWGGLGVKLGYHGVAVVGSAEEVVKLTFKRPLEVHVLAVVEVEQLWVSVEGRDAFLAALSKATGVAVSPPVASGVMG